MMQFEGCHYSCNFLNAEKLSFSDRNHFLYSIVRDRSAVILFCIRVLSFSYLPAAVPDRYLNVLGVNNIWNILMTVYSEWTKSGDMFIFVYR